MSEQFEDSDADLFAAARGGILRDLYVARAGTVTAYDATSQTVDVQPCVAEWFPAEGEAAVEQVYLPVVTAVPVAFPGGGGFRSTFPIAVGDSVLLVFMDRSHDAWQDQGGRQVPADLRRHHLTDAVAIVGVHDRKHAWTGASTSEATWGKDGGPQVCASASILKLGGTDASHPAIQGDAFQSALNTALTAIGNYLTTLGGLTGASAGAVTANTAITALENAVYTSTIVKVK